MSKTDDKKLLEFKCELAGLIGKHIVGLDESSISEVLEEYTNTLNRKPVVEQVRTHDAPKSSRTREAPPREAPPRTLQERSKVVVHAKNTPDSPQKLCLPTVFDDLRPRRSRPDKQWSLPATSVAAILQAVSTLPGPGLLKLSGGQQGAELLFNDGEIHELRLLPSSEKRSLLALLQDSGRLNAEQASRAKRLALAQDITETKALLQASDMITPGEVLSGVRTRIRHLTLRLIDAHPDSAAYFTLDELPASLQLVSVSAASLLFAHARAKYDKSSPESRKQSEGRLIGMLLSRKPNPTINVRRLNLQLHERLVLDQVLDKPRNCDAILSRSPLSREDTFSILTGLDAVGLLEITLPGLDESRSSSWVEDLDEAVERISEMEKRLEGENYFEIFKLHWATYDAEVERRYRELNEQFEILSQPMGLEPEQRKRLKQIRMGLKEIHAVLSDGRERQRHRRKFVPTEVQNKAAKKYETLGNDALHRKSYASALDHYQRLLELEPNNSRVSRLLPTLLMRASGS